MVRISIVNSEIGHVLELATAPKKMVLYRRRQRARWDYTIGDSESRIVKRIFV